MITSRMHRHTPFEPTDPNVCMCGWGHWHNQLCNFFWGGEISSGVLEAEDLEKMAFPIWLCSLPLQQRQNYHAALWCDERPMRPHVPMRLSDVSVTAEHGTLSATVCNDDRPRHSILFTISSVSTVNTTNKQLFTITSVSTASTTTNNQSVHSYWNEWVSPHISTARIYSAIHDGEYRTEDTLETQTLQKL